MNPRWCLFALVLLITTAENAFACTCAPPPPNATPAQLEEWRNGGITTIFEGTVEDAKMESPLTDALVGSIVPASLDENPPVMSVTFIETRFYRGTQAQTMKVETGLGGGDCGFQFELKRRYLVYAYKENL